MNYEVVKSLDELEKKCYSAWEFYPGNIRYKNCDNSIFLYEDGFDVIMDILDKIDPNFDYYGYSAQYNREEINKFKEGVYLRIKDVEENNTINYNGSSLNNYYCDLLNENKVKYKYEILNMLKELYEWLSSINDDVLNYISF